MCSISGSYNFIWSWVTYFRYWNLSISYSIYYKDKKWFEIFLILFKWCIWWFDTIDLIIVRTITTVFCPFLRTIQCVNFVTIWFVSQTCHSNVSTKMSWCRFVLVLICLAFPFGFFLAIDIFIKQIIVLSSTKQKSGSWGEDQNVNS
jgi:hypothetical protein